MYALGNEAVGKKPQNIKITPKLIEFEDHIIRVPNIASVTVGRDPRRLYLAIIVFVIGLGLLGQTLSLLAVARMMQGIGRGIGSYGAPVGVFLLSVAAFWFARRLFRYRALVISTADGRFTALVDRKPEFARVVMNRIREALLAGEEGSVYYQVNVSAEKIERLDANSTVVSNSAGAVVAGGSIDQREAVEASATSATVADLLNKAREQVTPVAGRALQTASEIANRSRAAAGERIAQFRQPREPVDAGSVHANTVTVNAAAPGSIIAGGAMTMIGSHVTAHGSVINEFDSVVAALSRLQITHKDEIIEYIRPVRDHLTGGATTRDDARTRWSWFAANVAATLAGVDGALAVIERVSRLLGIGR